MIQKRRYFIVASFFLKIFSQLYYDIDIIVDSIILYI